MSTDQATLVRYVATELADAFIADLHHDSDAEDRERIAGTVLCAGQHLADCGHPGVWARFDPSNFLPKMPVASEWELVGVCLDLVGLFGWMGFQGLLEPARVAEILTELQNAGPRHRLFAEHCEDTALMFRRLAPGEAS